MSGAGIDPHALVTADEGAAETTQFTIGAEASCSDGVCGELSRVVVDPIARTVTHLVVEPKHRRGLGRLVPLDIVDASSSEISLGCTMAEFNKLDHAEETEFVPATRSYAGYAPGHTLYWPYYGYHGPGDIGMGMSMGGGWGIRAGNSTQLVTHDTLRLGEVAVRRGDQVRATDGDIGRVEGLVIDTSTHHVTHVLLQEGHLWGHKEVAVPISAVTRVDTQIELDMTKEQVGELPSIDVDHPEAGGAES
jgi:sporulation protein YlmC with PRC-barrel domain